MVNPQQEYLRLEVIWSAIYMEVKIVVPNEIEFVMDCYEQEECL